MEKQNTILLNKDDMIITNSLHMVNRISTGNLYTREIMWNPICDWVRLSSMQKAFAEDTTDGPGNTHLVGGDDEWNSVTSTGRSGQEIGR